MFMLVSTHDFFAYIGHYPYWSIDDGLAVISTSLLQTGRYGDPSVPVEPFSGAQRYRGFFNYGPWYFLTGSALVWLFGFSVKLLRSIHLFAALSLAVVGHRLFKGVRGATATTMVGVGVGYAVIWIQWPMFRPDPFVTLFAGISIWGAARATLSGRTRDWFVSGAAAGCGAFSHLSGGTLIPASIAALVVSAVWLRRVPDAFGHRPNWFVRSLVALAGGWLASAVMFYASFGFRFADHLRLILSYRSVVQASMAAAQSGQGPIAVWREHYRLGTSGVAGVYLFLLAAALVTAAGLIWRALARPRAADAETVALLVPGCATFLCYAVGLGFYQNFHTGYVILPQLIAIWIAAATLYVVTGRVRVCWPGVGRYVENGAAVGLAILVAILTYRIATSTDDPRRALARSWIGISTYVNEVLGPVPGEAIAWGAYSFAGEGPRRIQLISFETGVRILNRVPVDRRPALVPDFLIWGLPQTRDAVLSPPAGTVIDPATLLRTIFPQTAFFVSSLTSAAPYGTTRVYARLLPSGQAEMPLVSAWDADLQRWRHRTIPVSGVTWSGASGSLRVSRGAQTTTLDVAATMVADLPADWYLFRVSGGNRSDGRQLFTAGKDIAHDFVVGDLPPPIDVAVQLAGEPVYLLQRHAGGVLGLNLLSGSPGAQFGTIETFRVAGFDDYRDAREQGAERPLPASSTWTPDTPGGVTAAEDGETLAVVGNATPAGYQVVSPRIAVRSGANVMVRLPISIQAGEVCTGILDGRQQAWLVAPTNHAEVHRFATGPNESVFIVVANCHRDGAAAPISRFNLGNGRYTTGADRWYTDELMRTW